MNHSWEGAAHLERLFPRFGRFARYPIAGHHTGLPDFNSPSRSDGDPLVKIAVPDCGAPDEAELKAALQFRRSAESMQLFLRMLFSALVDADRLDAEAVDFPERMAQRAKWDDFGTLTRRFEEYMANLEANAPDTGVNRCRMEILGACCAAAEEKPGFFELSVPTGGGKTLASFAFALKHLRKYGMRRIISAVNYTTIIEQSAAVYKSIFGTENVLEHHSTFDPDGDERAMLAAENWAAPIVVTTNVQLFESLLGARASAVRKIHNIAKSVIILDEVQMLPPVHLKPLLATLKLLVQEYGCSIVLFLRDAAGFFARHGAFGEPPDGDSRSVCNHT